MKIVTTLLAVGLAQAAFADPVLEPATQKFIAIRQANDALAAALAK